MYLFEKFKISENKHNECQSSHGTTIMHDHEQTISGFYYNCFQRCKLPKLKIQSPKFEKIF
jgi:hypothetical protein